MRRLHRSSGNTELTDSDSQSLTISGHQLARPPRAFLRRTAADKLARTTCRAVREFKSSAGSSHGKCARSDVSVPAITNLAKLNQGNIRCHSCGVHVVTVRQDYD